MLPCNPPNPAVEPIVFLSPHASLLTDAAMLAASLPVRLQLAGPPQNLDFGPAVVHPAQLQFAVVAALLVLVATTAVAACLATPSFGLLETSAAPFAGVQSPPVDLAAGS